MCASLTEPSDAPLAGRRARLRPLAAAAVLLLLSGAVAAGAEESTPPRVEEAQLAAGAIVRYEPAARRLELATSSGPLTLSVDLDTVIFTAAGVGTVRDLAPGVRVRAAFLGAPARAVWVELARAATEPEPLAERPPALPPPPPRAPGTTSDAPCDSLPCP